MYASQLEAFSHGMICYVCETSPSFSSTFVVCDPGVLSQGLCQMRRLVLQVECGMCASGLFHPMLGLGSGEAVCAHFGWCDGS